MTVFLLALSGLLFGPFLHALAVQAGSDQPLRPHTLSCPRCDHTSWTIKCGCGRYRWRELATGVTASVGMAAVGYSVGLRPVLAAHVLMVAVTTILIVTDFDHFRIPNRILYPGTVAAVGVLGASAIAEGLIGAFLRGLLGGVIYLSLFLAVYLAARGQGFGFGDVKLAFLLGVFAAFHSWQVLARGLFITALLGGIPAIVLLVMGRSRSTFLPYGPPLILGTWAGIAIM